MPPTLSFNLVHVIFTTRRQLPLIKDGPALYAYLAGAARELGCDCFRAGGTANHIHLALKLDTTKAAAKVITEIKKLSSAWMKTEAMPTFAWQRGYCLFSVSPAHTGALIQYIEGQHEYHRRHNLQAELRGLLEKYHVTFDERTLWN